MKKNIELRCISGQQISIPTLLKDQQNMPHFPNSIKGWEGQSWTSPRPPFIKEGGVEFLKFLKTGGC